MLRYFKFCLLFFGALLAVVAYAQDDTFSDAELKGVFWEVKKKGGVPSYLLGTMHTDDPRVLNVPDLIQNRFDRADSASFEVKMDASSLMQSMGAMFLDSGQTLKSVIEDKEIYQSLIEQLEEHGMPEMAVQQLKPWAIMIMVSMPKNESGQFLDLVLYQQAQQQQKQIYGLEKIDEQLQFFTQLSIEDQVSLLQETLEQLDQIPDFFEQLHDMYLRRALGEMYQFYQKYAQESEDTELMEKFNKGLLQDRNFRMLKRMQDRLHEGNAFIAVGALHLAGPKGLLQLLQQQGYQLKALY